MCNRLEQYSICSYLFPGILALPKYVQPARFAFDLLIFIPNDLSTFHSFKPVRFWLVICNCQSFSWISLNVCALSLCVCAWFSDMVRVAQLKHGAKLKTRQRKLETWKQLAASAPAADIAKTIVERATAWATAASQAEDAAMALYDMEIAIALTTSFELERFIATAEAVDASVAASTAAAKVLANAMSRFGGTSIE